MKGVAGSIAAKQVTYDLARDVQGATVLSSSGFGESVIKYM